MGEERESTFCLSAKSASEAIEYLCSRVDVSGAGNGCRHRNRKEPDPISDRPMSQGSTANLWGTVATCMEK